MDRFYLQPGAWNDASLLIEGDEGHHCARVMRKTAGDEIEVFDGEGRWVRGVIEGVEGEAVAVRLGSERGESVLPPVKITLAVAIPKGKTMELIVQKAVELGVSAIQPLVTEHTVVRVEGKEAEKKRAKWRRVALEACKQCGQNVLPEVFAPVGFEKWLAGRERSRSGIVASLAEGARPFREVIGALRGVVGELDLLIGPEGDFSAAETVAALAGGFQPVTLGEITLRVETAVLYCLSVLGYELKMG